MFLTKLNFLDSSNPNAVVEQLINEWKSTNNGSYIVHYLYYSNYVLLFKDKTFNKNLLLANTLLIDGIGMQLYMKIVLGKWVFNLNGTDLNPIFIDRLSQTKVPIALYGTNKANIEKARENLINKGIESIYYIQDGYSPLNWEEIKRDSALFIGLGSPMQELWVGENISKIKEYNLLVITVGGYFDFESGFYIRAPLLVRKLKFEWLWRTMLHPKRHYKKRLRDLSIIWRPFVDKLKGYGKLIHLNDLESYEKK